jgi:dTDP-6-deoxy-L-talose 4-dehydrogenase (NAD+)
MKICVIGGTGFIGSNLIPILLSEGHQLLVTGKSKSKAEKFPWYKEVLFLELDIRSEISNSTLNDISNVDKLIYLAWDGLPNYNSLNHIENNLFHSYFILKKLIQKGLKDILVLGTCFEYGKRDGILKTSLVTDPVNSYAIAKDSLRKFIFLLKNEYKFEIKWVRLFYLHGLGQNENSLIPLLLKAVKDKQEFFNMSSGEQIRDYLTVDEVCEKLVYFTLLNNESGIYNCCSGIPISVRRFVEEYISKNQFNIKLNLNFYPQSEYESFCFWGEI